MRLSTSLAAAAMVASVAAVTSPASAETPCNAPCTYDPPPAATKMRSVPVFVTGVVLDVVGAAAFAGGTGVVLATHDCGTQISCSAGGTLIDIAGVAAMAGGAILLAIGIPLTVVGATSVPDMPSKTGKAGGLVW